MWYTKHLYILSLLPNRHPEVTTTWKLPDSRPLRQEGIPSSKDSLELTNKELRGHSPPHLRSCRRVAPRTVFLFVNNLLLPCRADFGQAGQSDRDVVEVFFVDGF